MSAPGGRIGCDPTEHRYRVTDVSNPVRYVDMRRSMPTGLRLGLESAPGAMPMHWWVARGPVSVVFDPAAPVGARP